MVCYGIFWSGQLGTLMSRGVMHVKEIGNKIRLKGIGFLDSFVDTLCSTTPHHLLMLRTVRFMEAFSCGQIFCNCDVGQCI